jgi:hypothetical protein
MQQWYSCSQEHRTKRAQKPAAPKAKTRQPAQLASATTATGRSQPAMILEAIRTAPQPLTIED